MNEYFTFESVNQFPQVLKTRSRSFLKQSFCISAKLSFFACTEAAVQRCPVKKVFLKISLRNLVVVFACNDLRPEMIVRAFTAMFSRTGRRIGVDTKAFSGE